MRTGGGGTISLSLLALFPWWLAVSFMGWLVKKKMKSNRPLRRRLLELGMLVGQDVKIAQHASGYILKVRNCTYVIGEDGIDTVLEMLSEI